MLSGNKSKSIISARNASFLVDVAAPIKGISTKEEEDDDKKSWNGRFYGQWTRQAGIRTKEWEIVEVE